MARLFTSGFETNSVTDGVEWGIVSGSPTISSAVKRSGSYAGRISSLVSGTRQQFRIKLDASGFTASDIYVRFYFRADTLPSADNTIAVTCPTTSPGDAANAKIVLTSAGTLKLIVDGVQIGSASAALTTGTWYRIEFRHNRSLAAGSQIAQAKLNGIQFASATNLTLASGVMTCRFGGNVEGEAQTQGDWYFDDIGINDGTGSYQNTWLGAGLVRTWGVAFDGSHTGGIGSDGGSSIASYMDDFHPPNDATDYWRLSNINDEFLEYNTSGFQNLPVTLTHVFVRMRSSAGQTFKIKVRDKSPFGSELNESAELTITSGVTWSTGLAFVLPSLTSYLSPHTGQPWTEDEIYDGNFGVIVTDPGAGEVWFTSLWYTVEYNDTAKQFKDTVGIQDDISKGFFKSFLETISMVASNTGGKTSVFAVQVLNLISTLILKPSAIRKDDLVSLLEIFHIGSKRYWVGGSGSWDDTAHWSRTSGGTSGAPVPTSTDDVIFDANSLSGTSSLTIPSGQSCNSFDLSGLTNNLNVTFGSANLDCYGSITLSTHLVGTLWFNLQSSGSETIDPNSCTNPATSFFLEGSGSYKVLGTLYSDYIQIHNGTMDFNGQTIYAAHEVNVTDITFSNRPLGLSFSGATVHTHSLIVWYNPNLTINVSTGTLYIEALGLSPSTQMVIQMISFPNGVTLPFNNVTMTVAHHFFNAGNAPLYNQSFLGKMSFNNLTIIGGAFADSAVAIQGDYTVTGTLTMTGNSAINRLFIEGDEDALTTITAAAVSLDKVSFRNIVAGGAVPWTGTSIGDGGKNQNITGATQVTRYWVGDTGSYSDTAHWSATSGGTGGASLPLPQDIVIFDANSFSADGALVTIDYLALGEILDNSAVTKAVTFGVTAMPFFIFGDLKNNPLVGWLQTDNTVSNTILVIYPKLSTVHIESNGIIFPFGITIPTTSVSVILDDDLSMIATLYLSGTGSFDANGNNMAMASLQFYGATVHLGEGTLLLSGNSSTVWFSSFNGVYADNRSTLYPETATIIFAGGSTDPQELALQTCTLITPIYKVIINGVAVNLEDSPSIDNLIIEAASIVRIESNFSNQQSYVIRGTADDPVDISAFGIDSFFTHDLPATALVDVTYATLTGDRLLFPETHRAINTVDGGGNAGWLFVNNWTKTLSDSATLTATISKFRGAVVTLTESIMLVAGNINRIVRGLVDSLSLTEDFFGDRPRYLRTKVFADSLSVADSFIKGVIRIFRDLVGFSDTFNRVLTAVRSFVESSSLLQQFAANTQRVKILTENMTLVEAFDKGRRYVKTLTETITNTATIVARRLTLLVLTEKMIVTADRLVIRFNGLMTALWGRIARQTPGFVKLVKSSTAGWNKQAKSSTGATKIAKDLGQGKWGKTPKDQ